VNVPRRGRLRADAWPRSAPPVRRLLQRHRPEVVASRIQEWDAAGKDVFIYFNNDGNANAVRNARTLGTFFFTLFTQVV
jgi:hypothetical protein